MTGRAAGERTRYARLAELFSPSRGRWALMGGRPDRRWRMSRSSARKAAVGPHSSPCKAASTTKSPARREQQGSGEFQHRARSSHHCGATIENAPSPMARRPGSTRSARQYVEVKREEIRQRCARLPAARRSKSRTAFRQSRQRLAGVLRRPRAADASAEPATWRIRPHERLDRLDGSVKPTRTAAPRAARILSQNPSPRLQAGRWG